MATAIAPHPVDRDELGGLLPSPSPEGRVRFSRDGFHRLEQLGILNGDARVELLDGEIFTMMPIGPPQGSLISRLAEFFTNNLPDSLQCRVQLPIVVGDHSEPQPNIAIVRRRDDDYQKEHPAPSDVALLIEVAQSSLSFDFGRRLQVYAGGGISEYWVLNVGEKLVVVHREPSGSAYKSVQSFGPGDTVAPLTVPDCRLELASLFR